MSKVNQAEAVLVLRYAVVLTPRGNVVRIWNAQPPHLYLARVSDVSSYRGCSFNLNVRDKD